MKQEEKSLLSRNKILEASGALFAEKGFDSTTMQDIMARSGLSKGAIAGIVVSIFAVIIDNTKMMLCNWIILICRTI